jgi:hypothetical protein
MRSVETTLSRGAQQVLVMHLCHRVRQVGVHLSILCLVRPATAVRCDRPSYASPRTPTTSSDTLSNRRSHQLRRQLLACGATF